MDKIDAEGFVNWASGAAKTDYRFVVIKSENCPKCVKGISDIEKFIEVIEGGTIDDFRCYTYRPQDTDASKVLSARGVMGVPSIVRPDPDDSQFQWGSDKDLMNWLKDNASRTNSKEEEN